MLGHLDQPRQDGIGVDLEHAGHGTDAQTLRQRAHRPHQQVGRDAFAMQRGTMSFENVAIAGGTVELPPGATTGMAVRLEIPTASPPIIGTVRMGTEMLCGRHRAWAPP